MITICNKCGLEVLYTNPIDFKFNYGSHFDLERWRFNLCDDCIEDIIRTFNVAPHGFMVDKYIPISEEKHKKLFEEWKITDEWDEFSVMTYGEILDLVGSIDKEYLNEKIIKYHPDRKIIE